MPKIKCVSCLGKNVKAIIMDSIPDLRQDLEAIPDCPDRNSIIICRSVGSGRSRRAGAKRSPSPYNLFVSKCMKDGNIHGRAEAAARMKVCGAQWRQGAGRG